MKKFFLFAALGLSVMAQAVELNYYKTLVDEQADATKGTVQLYNLEYAADGSIYGLAMYQTASANETGLHFAGNAYVGATASKWGSKPGELKVTNMRNSFLYKLDKDGELLWAKPDTTGDYDPSNSTIAVLSDGGVIYADKFRGRKGTYMSFFNMYNKDGQLVASNSMSFTNYDSIEVDGKMVKRKEAFSWAGAAQDENGFVFIAGLQGDTLVPTWSDSIAPRKAWNTKGSLSSNCNTVILKYKPQYNQFMDLDYVGAVINSDDLDYDRPTGMHYENGKLYMAGTYGKGTEKGIYAACYNTNLEREYIVYHPIEASLQFQQTKFEDGKIFVCGGIMKGGIKNAAGDSIKTVGNMYHGLVYILNQADGQFVDATLNSAKNNALNLSVAAYPTKEGYVVYNYEYGTNTIINYDQNLQVVSKDTIATGGGSSTITCVGRTEDGKQTAVGFRSKASQAFNLQGNTISSDVTNWLCVVAAFNTQDKTEDIEDIVAEEGKAVKFIKNGQLLIRHNGRTYNVLGF